MLKTRALSIAPALVLWQFLVLFLPAIVKADELDDALGQRDVIKVRQLLAQDPNLVNRRDRLGHTPLFFASGIGNLELVKLLLNQGADPKASDPHGDQPIHEAARSRNTAVVQALLEKGADVNARGFLATTPLHQAVIIKSDKEMCAFLLSRGAAVNLKDELGDTPLHAAALTEGQSSAIELLIDHGADITARNNIGEMPMGLAGMYHQAENAAVLLQHGAKWDIFSAASLGNLAEVKVLLKADLRLVATTNSQGTALLPAVVRGNEDIVRVLLENGADPNATDWQSRSVLTHAKQRGYTAIATLLRSYGARD